MGSEDIEGIEHLFNRLKLNTILHLFQNQPQNFDVKLILAMESRDVDDIVPVQFLQERIKLREYIHQERRKKTKSGDHPGIVINLEDLMKGECKSYHLLEGSQSPLEPSDCRILARLIVNFWHINQYKPTRTDYVHAFERIEEKFKAEKIEDWIGGKNSGRGIIHEFMYNQNKFRKRKSGNSNNPKNGGKNAKLSEKSTAIGGKNGRGKGGKNGKQIEGNQSTSSIAEEVQPGVDDANIASEEEECLNLTVDQCFETLKSNTGPIEKITFSWKKTFEKRQESKYYIEDFKALQGVNGPALITLDFKEKYNKGNLLALKFQVFKSKILPVLKKNIRDAKCKDFLKKLDQPGITMNAENFIYFSVLHGYLKPRILKDEGIKKLHSILDSQKYFITLVNKTADIQTRINEMKCDKKSNNGRLGPFIVAVGDSVEQVMNFTAYIDENLYEFDDLLEALSFLFMAHWNIGNGLQYQEECYLIWKFIEVYFFEMGTTSVKAVKDLVKIL